MSGDSGAKERILEAAAAEFAERGFDGARVDAIAKTAGVNKALIYYYYSSKEALLEILFQEIRDSVMGMIATPGVKRMDLDSKATMVAMMQEFLDLLESRQNVIRVVIMELSKRTPINARIFGMVEEIMNAMFEITGDNASDDPETRSRLMVTEFFTGIMPLLNYVAYHEIWMERYGVDEKSLRDRFIESFLGTHFAYTIGTF